MSASTKIGLSEDCFQMLERLHGHSGREFGFGERLLAELTPELGVTRRDRALQEMIEVGLIYRSELLDGTTQQTFVVYDLIAVERAERIIHDFYAIAPLGLRSRPSSLAERVLAPWPS